MIYEEDKTTTASDDENIKRCEEKVEKLNKKLQATANELEEISSFYAKSVKEGLDKAKRIKELEDEIDKLEKQLKECQDKRKELEDQLKECQDKRKELENQLKEAQDKGNRVDQLEQQLKECQKEREELERQLKECQDKRKELEDQLKECQEKSNKAEKNKKISSDLKNSKIPTTIFSLATDKDGNVYVGTRSNSWHGGVYKCTAGESIFKLIPGVDGEVWTMTTDDDDNIYVGTREGVETGGVYKCTANNNNFKKIEGIDKCVFGLEFDGTTLVAKVWTGIDWNWQTYNNTHKLLATESKFNPKS